MRPLLFYGNAKTVDLTPVDKSGTISSNETWTGIIHVTGDVKVATGVNLTINAGTLVRFTENYKIESLGQIQAVGTVGSRIVFEPHPILNTSGVFFGVWCGAEVDAFNVDAPDSGAFFKFEYCDFIDGDKTSKLTIGHRGRKRGGGIFAENVLGGLTIDNCTFTDCKSQENGGGVFIQKNSPFNVSYAITNCTFTDCLADGDVGGWLGGGLMVAHPDNQTLTSNSFSGCVASPNFQDVGVTVDNSADEITTPVAHDMLTGSSVVFGGTAVPTGLTAGVEYYAIVTSTTKFKPATTIALANASTPINLTDDGTSVNATVHQDWYLFDVQGSLTIA